MKKTSGTTPLWVNLLAIGITLLVVFIGLPALVIGFSKNSAPKVEVSQPKTEAPSVLPETLPQTPSPTPEGSQEPEESEVEDVAESAVETVPSPAMTETPQEKVCPNDGCAILPETLLKDAHQRGCKRIVVRPPTRILTKDELVKVAGLVYGRLTCRHDMTFDWPGESVGEGDDVLYKQDLEGTSVYFRFGSW